MKRSAALPLAGTVAAVAALAVAVALVQPGGSSEPRPLHLAAGGTAARDAAAPSAAGSGTGGSGYALTGTLPAGTPDDAPAYTLPKGPAEASVVAALAKALKAGTAVRDGDAWRAGGLFVSGDAGQGWWFSPCAKDTPVAAGERVVCASDVGGGVVAPAPPPVDGGGSASSPGSAPDVAPATGSAVAPPPPTPVATPGPSLVAEPEPISKDAVRAAAAPVFQALGLDPADARVDAGSYGGSVTLLRTVGGLEVSGMQTSVQVDREGTVQGAGGFLAQPDKGDSYPLVAAQAAYDELPPLMTTMMCPVAPDGKGCLPPEPTEITGAHLGLMLSALVDGGQALVPAWLFDVRGWTEPLAVVAVQKQYLPEPTAAPTTKPEPGVSTDPGAAVPPEQPSGDPGVARQTVRVDRAYAGTGSTLIAVFGDSSSCMHENVTGVAKESADTVWVLVEGDTRPNTFQACTDDYLAVEVVVKLQAPLGDRNVVDLSTNKPVPRT